MFRTTWLRVVRGMGLAASWRKHRASRNSPAVEAKAKRPVARCTKLLGYIEGSEGALIPYGQRHPAGKPLSTSRAGGNVSRLVNARMNKHRRMRWSLRGVRRVLQVRAAVLDDASASTRSSSQRGAPGF